MGIFGGCIVLHAVLVNVWNVSKALSHWRTGNGWLFKLHYAQRDVKHSGYRINYVNVT